MKGDFSRLRFNKRKEYVSVLKQQGRVSLDSDDNEQAAIDEYLRATETLDIVGPVGGPVGDEGFLITIVDNQLSIGPGRYYVNGILCENAAELLYADQPYLLDSPLTEAELLEIIRLGKDVLQVYLEVWQRLVTALDDSCLREPALGLADTTARLQTVWRVIARPQLLTVGNTTLQTLGEDNNLRLNLTKSDAGLTIAGTNLPAPADLTPSCCKAMRTGPITVIDSGTLTARTGDGTDDCSCEPTPAAGYRGLENQLYRVEIHQAGTASLATFKWSRENASVVVQIIGVSGSNVHVDTLGPDVNLGFSNDQWVEIYDDHAIFGPTPNQSGELYQIQSITRETLTVTLDRTIASVDPSRNARMRRWDQSGASATSAGIVLSEGTWLALENGIEVQFSAGNFSEGDYWLIPARTANGQIDWPPCDSDGNAAQPGRRTTVFLAPLACIQGVNGAPNIQDCRTVFYPLTGLGPSRSSTAIQISKINWSNDDLVTFDQFLAAGLSLELTQALTSPVTGGNFVVTTEVAILSANSISTYNPGEATSFSLNLYGVETEIDVAGDVITWRMPYQDVSQAQTQFLFSFNLALTEPMVAGHPVRLRIRLLGRSLFAGSGASQLFLDGQCFGESAKRLDGVTDRIDLQLPSGNGEKASDFESWLYLAPAVTLVSVAVNPAEVAAYYVDNTGTPVVVPYPETGPSPSIPVVGTVTVSYPVTTATLIQLSLSPQNYTIPTGAVSIPSAVTIPSGSNSQTFAVTVNQAPPFDTTYVFQITAVYTSKIGQINTQMATFTVVNGYIYGS